MLTVPSAADLSEFSGEAVAAAYTDTTYVSSVLQQATDLLQLLTNLTDDPADEFQMRVLRYAELELAQALYFSQAHRRVLLTPYSSERIGNYSYQKIAAAVQSGVPLGLMWYDQALDLFSQLSVAESTSTQVFEDDGVWLKETTGEPRRVVLGPQELEFGHPAGRRVLGAD